MDLLKNCFDILKPWLDRDMYFNIEEEKTKVRVNSKTHKNSIPENKEKDDGDDIIVGE